MYHEWISILSKAEVVQSAISYHGHVSARNPMHENIYIILYIYFYIHNTEVVLGGGTKCHFVPRRFFSQDAPRSGDFLVIYVTLFEKLCMKTSGTKLQKWNI